MPSLTFFELTDSQRKGMKWDNGSYEEYVPVSASLAAEIERLQAIEADYARRGEALERIKEFGPSFAYPCRIATDALIAIAATTAPQGEVRE